MALEQKFNVPLNLLNLELRNAKFQSLAAAPSGIEALFYYDSVLKTPRFYDGTDWVNLDARKATNIPLSALATDPLARANHTGTQLANTISNFDIQVRTSRLDQMAAPTAAVSLNSQKITNLATPTVGTDAATKAYVDGASTTGNAATATKLATARAISLTGVVTAVGVNFDGSAAISLTTAIADGALTIAKTSGLQSALDGKQASLGFTPVNKAGDTMLGTLTLAADPVNPMEAATKQYVDTVAQAASAGIDPKDAVKVATTTNITLTGTQTVDGVALVVGDFVLVKNQTTPSQNGIYVVSATGWTRRNDAIQNKLTQGALVLVTGGATHGGQQWYLQTNDPITVGSTGLVWIQFNAITPYTNGNGLNLVGQEFSVKAKPSGGIVVDGTGVGIDVAVVARKYSVTIGNGSLTSFTITHNLGTLDVSVTLRNLATNDVEYAGVTIIDTNSLSVSFATGAPALNSYRVTVTG